ncbi:uncharacterized protein B0H18DRAFT_673422 [Fomitopsis serialis]|uniref:uncharacterized protein n=1 Tax=Fomitopsis serialis TaxID=139415 RepID=UPI0020082E93|nr:uncharacterized protein B0H18DRAFT_673422 [Neoantrodia serialis]KAH9932978.1 hypothetical protein B0H18DRAFT_673422 [Neoantrodia serialis]
MLALNYLFILVLPTVLTVPLPNPYVVWHNPQNITEPAALTPSINPALITTNVDRSRSVRAASGDHGDLGDGMVEKSALVLWERCTTLQTLSLKVWGHR